MDFYKLKQKTRPGDMFKLTIGVLSTKIIEESCVMIQMIAKYSIECKCRDSMREFKARLDSYVLW